MKTIAVILINYNSSEYTLQCIRSVIARSKENMDYSIVVVDNHSRPDEFSKLEVLQAMNRVALVRMPVNCGFSAANEAGMNIVPARYYYFLNNDTVLQNDVLTILLDWMENNPDTGIVSGQMYHSDGTRGINFNYFPDLRLKFLGSGLLRLFYPKQYPKKGVAYTSPLQVPLLNGSSLFIRKTALDAAGGFDTRFFLYCEEEDLAIRMKKTGYSCFLVPEARYTHFEGKSSIRDQGINYLMLQEFYISQHYLYLKHYGKAAAWTWRISQFFRTIRKFFLHRDYIKLAFFILRHPYEKYSLRYHPQ